MPAATFMNQGTHSTHPYLVFLNYERTLLQHSWNVKISHAMREANCVADCLASISHHAHQGLVFFYDPPLECKVFLCFDSIGTLYPRPVKH